MECGEGRGYCVMIFLTSENTKLTPLELWICLSRYVNITVVYPFFSVICIISIFSMFVRRAQDPPPPFPRIPFYPLLWSNIDPWIAFFKRQKRTLGKNIVLNWFLTLSTHYPRFAEALQVFLTVRGVWRTFTNIFDVLDFSVSWILIINARRVKHKTCYIKLLNYKNAQPGFNEETTLHSYIRFIFPSTQIN